MPQGPYSASTHTVRLSAPTGEIGAPKAGRAALRAGRGWTRAGPSRSEPHEKCELTRGEGPWWVCLTSLVMGKVWGAALVDGISTTQTGDVGNGESAPGQDARDGRPFEADISMLNSRSWLGKMTGLLWIWPSTA
ncbi:hypothetical protein AcV5_000353 [Taiwanofungus camphoratus]|nr:hypothetical protein AcV5_000353 [Antrodia cinnamomea]